MCMPPETSPADRSWLSRPRRVARSQRRPFTHRWFRKRECFRTDALPAQRQRLELTLAHDLKIDAAISVVGCSDRAHEIDWAVDLDVVSLEDDVAAAESGAPCHGAFDDVHDKHALRPDSEDLTQIRIQLRELGAGEWIDQAAKAKRGRKNHRQRFR